MCMYSLYTECQVNCVGTHTSKSFAYSDVILALTNTMRWGPTDLCDVQCCVTGYHDETLWGRYVYEFNVHL